MNLGSFALEDNLFGDVFGADIGLDIGDDLARELGEGWGAPDGPTEAKYAFQLFNSLIADFQ